MFFFYEQVCILQIYMIKENVELDLKFDVNLFIRTTWSLMPRLICLCSWLLDNFKLEWGLIMAISQVRLDK